MNANGDENRDETGARADKPVYELPVTDPAAPPFGVPGMGGAMPPARGTLPPGVPPEASTAFSRLPPPVAASAAPAAPAPPLPSFPPPQPGAVPPPAPAGPAVLSVPVAPAPAAPPAPAVPPAPPAAPAAPPAPAVAPAAPAAVPAVAGSGADGLPAAARASADPDLLTALQLVVSEGASDLHISNGAPPMFRVDGSLHPVPGAATWDRAKVAAALRSILKPEQSAQFDGALELDFAFTLSATTRFRVNYYQQRGSIGGAFRIIPTKIKALGELGVPEVVGRFAELARGLVLVTGPTGSGKSTTLAALIDLVNETRADHIVTVEDPIEFVHPNKRSLVNQREVGEDTRSFANALKHVLRQDPDVILIGELRDLETISVALTAAETGHLVFATLHTQDAGQTIDRVIDVFPPHQQGQVRAQLAATLQGVVCQTLVKRAGGTGRAVATEVLVATPAISNLIREGKTYQVRSALQAGRGQGMNTMDQHLAELVNSGQVGYADALEKVHDAEDFTRLVHRTDGVGARGFGQH